MKRGRERNVLCAEEDVPGMLKLVVVMIEQSPRCARDVERGAGSATRQVLEMETREGQREGPM